MQLFYDPDILEGTHQLRDGEARHAFRVLRKRAGDTLDLVDGKGGWYRGEIESIDKRACTLSVRRTRRETPPNYQVTLLVAPTKNIDRFEWLLEKCTEIGIYAIQPFISEHSERKNIRVDRLERVIESAMKQSLRAWKPTLFDCMSYDRAIASVSAAQPKFLAYLGSDRTPMLHRVSPAGKSAVVAVGPEGGFSPREANQALDAGFAHVSLGPNRLRTETAAITAVHTINQLNWSTP